MIFVSYSFSSAGKWAPLSILGGLVGRMSGSMVLEGGVVHSPHGAIGTVPR